MALEAFFLGKAAEILKALIQQLSELRKIRNKEIDDVEKTFGPVEQLAPFYIIPNAQNVNPADFPEDDTGLVARNNVFDLLNTFLAGASRFSHAFILSDAGMGKTSLLVMIKLLHLNKFIKPDYDVVLLKIGPTTTQELNKISTPHRTVLLLDALDEDSEAWQHFYTRLQILLQATKSFRKVIITCRTQFFPKEQEEDGKVPGQVILSGFYCSKIFLSPFNDTQVENYLHKRFSDEEQICKARKIVQRMHSLKFRPMLLSYIDFLIDHEQHYNNTYSIYEALVEEWLNREMRKGVVKDKNILREACYILALDMYKDRKQSISSDEVVNLCKPLEGVRHLEYMTIEGRSLLHRTSEGGYKFAHYSILEYFIATWISQHPENLINTDQVIRFIADMISFRELKKAAGLDLKKIPLQGINVNSVTFSDSSLIEADFRNASLDHCVFKNADLHLADFTQCSLAHANLKEALCREAVFIGVDFSNAILQDINFSDCDMQKTNLSSCRIKGSSFSKCNLESATLSGIEDVGIVFDKANLGNSVWEHTTIPEIRMSEAKLEKVLLKSCDLRDGMFEKSKWDHSDISNSILSKSIFNECSLSNARLAHTKLDNASLLSVEAQNCDFKNCDATNANFSKSELPRSKPTKLQGSKFGKSMLSNSKFVDAIIDGAEYTNAIMNDAVLEGSRGKHADFTGASLRSANFRSGLFEGSIFVAADLSASNFEKAKLKDCNFDEALITSVNLSNASLDNARFEGNDIVNASFVKSDLRGCMFRECRIVGCNFSEAVLYGVIFKNCNVVDCKWLNSRYDRDTVWPDGLDGTRLEAFGPRTRLVGKTYKGIDLKNVDLRSCHIRDCVFSDCKLSGCNLTGSVLSDTKFVGCNMRGTIIYDAQIYRVDFSHTDLREANLSRAEITSAIFNDAIYSLRTSFPPKFAPKAVGMVQRDTL